MIERKYGKREDRIAEAIREGAAMYIEGESNQASLITVTRVEVDEHLKKGIIFVTVLPESKGDEAIAFLRRLRNELRRYILKHSRMPRVPFLDIVLDTGEKNRERIEELFRKIKEEEQGEK